jgi:competence ComEA-like helix-hairpin-helix protein
MRKSSVSICRVLLALVLAAAASGQTAAGLPDGKGKAQFTRICGQCHAVEIIIKNTNTIEGWSLIVDDMASRGAQATDDEFDLVLKYLAAHFGPKVNVNKADAKKLSTVLELSIEDAGAIVHYRETAGSFKEWRDFTKVPNIDIKKLEQVKDRIDFSDGPDSSAAKK